MSKSGVILNGLVLFLLGVRIELYNRMLFKAFKSRRLPSLCRLLDKRLHKLRKEFALLEERHRAISPN